MARRPKKKNSIRVDLSNVSSAFEPNQEYSIRCTECTLEEGTKAPYFNLKIQGIEGGDYENSTMYHRASTSESSLWRLRPLMEAFGFEIPDGPLDISAEDFVDREAMCSTYLDRYDGGSSVKPDEFWPLEGSDDGDSDDKDAGEDFDLDELDDDEIEALAEELEVKGRTVAAKKKKLAAMDVDDVAEAYAGLDKAGDDEDGKGDDAEDFDLDELDDDEIEELAKAMKVRGRTVAAKKKALAKLDEDEVAEAYAELSGSGDGGSVTEDDIQEMSEDELEELIEKHELDVDLSDHKTLRKQKNAVIDACEEAGLFE